jgi:hypothetical protein
MAMINIVKDYRKYSSEELRSLAYSGLLECNGYDLDSFLEYIFQDMYSEQDLKEAFEEGKKEALDSEISICSECEEEIYG